MFLRIITPDKEIFSGEVSSVTLPGKKGSFQVLNNHAALISTLDAGKMSYQSSTEIINLEIKEGVVEVLNNTIQVLVEGVKK